MSNIFVKNALVVIASASLLMATSSAHAVPCTDDDTWFVKSVAVGDAGFAPREGYDDTPLLAISVYNTKGDVRYFSSKTYGDLTSTGPKSDATRANLQLALVAYQAGAPVKITNNDDKMCRVTEQVDGKNWILGMKAIWMDTAQ